MRVLLTFIATLLLVALIVTGFLVALDRRDRRERDERAVLLQRIQAPQAAVAEHHVEVSPPPLVPVTGSMPMSDVEMAEAQQARTSEEEKQRLIRWMEDVENGTAQIVDGVLR